MVTKRGEGFVVGASGIGGSIRIRLKRSAPLPITIRAIDEGQYRGVWDMLQNKQLMPTQQTIF
jgi:hypothetical protein